MADPSSFMVGNAPQGASFAAPLIGMALGQQIAQYPQQYYQGQQSQFQQGQNQRTLNLQRPILDPNTGQPTNDPNQIISELQRRGGAEYSEKLLPFIYGGAADARVANVFAGNGPEGTGPSSPPSTVTPGAANPGANHPGAAGPGNLTRRPNAPPSNNGQNNQGAPTVLSIAQGLFQGIDGNVAKIISGISRQLGITPNQPLSPQQAEQIKTAFGNTAMPGGTPNGPQNNGATAGQVPGRPSGDDQSNGVNAAPTPSAGVSGSPAPAQTAQAQPQAPQGPAPPFAPRPQPQANQGDPTLNGLVPQQWIAQGKTASQYRDLLAAMAGQRMISPGAKDAALARVKAIDEYMGKTGEQAQESALKLSPQALAFEGQKTAQAKQIEIGQKQYDAVNAQAHQYEGDLRPDLQLLRGALDDAKLYTGLGADFVLNANRLKTMLGGDPSPARLQELLEKVSAKSTLAAINIQRDQAAEAGASSGRIFKQQIDQINKSTYRLENTAAGNRTLVELADRVGKQGVVLAQMARDYLDPQKGGHITLDRGYDQQVHDYLSSHPMFTPEELNNTALIAPPLARTSGDAAAFVQKFPGQPFRVPQEAARQMGVQNAPVREDGTVILTHLMAKGQTQAQQPMPGR